MPSPAAAANAASNSAPDRTSYTRASRPNSRATDGSAFSVPSAAAYSGLRTTPTRENPRPASRSSSTLLPTRLTSLDSKNPVTLPPGRAKLSTSPSAAGSSTLPNQIKGVCLLEASLAPGEDVPRHVHTREDETYYVLSG